MSPGIIVRRKAILPGGRRFSAVGGTITFDGPFTVHTFTSGGTFTPNGSGNVDYLVVGGGGGKGGQQEMVVAVLVDFKQTQIFPLPLRITQ